MTYMPISIDLFAGCGGLTRGLEDSGFRCLAFNEINKDAADSFALNFPDAIRLDGDIREAVSNEIIEKEILPVAGEIVEFNSALEDDPSLINNEPFGDGWIIKVKVSDTSDVEALMNADAYAESLG